MSKFDDPPPNMTEHIAPLSSDTLTEIKEHCRDLGCTCGDELAIRTTPIDRKDWPERVRNDPSVAKGTHVNVFHLLSCPLSDKKGKDDEPAS